MKINIVGVIGCGTMGAGITQVIAQGGYRVKVYDLSNEAIKNGLSKIDYWLQKSVDKKKIAAKGKKDIMDLIMPSTDMASFSDCDFIVESVQDNLEIKKKVFTKLDDICPEHTILASCASSLSIIDIAAVTKRMDKVVGMHFFNPVPAMKLVELVQTVATSEGTLKAAKSFSTKIGKTVIVAQDMPGYIHNRLTSVITIAAIKMLEDKVATRDEIDTALRLGSNMPMGRLEICDLVGLDVILEGYENLYQAYKDIRYNPPVLLRNMVSAGWLGRKVGRGFYKYDKDGNRIG